MGWSQERILEEIESDDRRATEMRAKNYAAANPEGWLNGLFQKMILEAWICVPYALLNQVIDI